MAAKTVCVIGKSGLIVSIWTSGFPCCIFTATG